MLFTPLIVLAGVAIADRYTPSHVQVYGERDFDMLPPNKVMLYPRQSSQVGDIVNGAINSQIKNGVDAIVAAFNVSDIPQEILDLVSNALNLPLSQYISSTPTDQQLANLQSQVEKKLADIQNSVITGLTEGEDFETLRACIKSVVEAAGATSGQRCLMDNGADVEDLKESFEQTINQYYFILPIETMNEMIARIDDYLSSSSLIDPAKELIKNIESAMQSVVATTSGEYTEAIYHATDCFFSALSADVYSQADIYDCETKSTNSDGTISVGSTLTNVENMYRAIVNQYIGYLQPNLVQDIQAIGAELLPQGTPGSPALSMADSINQAILSVVASTSGSQVSIAYQLVDCLNIMYTADPSTLDEAKAASQSCAVGSGIQESQKLITDGYIQQFYGVLPPKLTLLLQEYDIPDGADADQVKAELQKLFESSAAGPEYVTCYEKFTECTVNAVKALEKGEAAETCAKGDACQDVPFRLDIGNSTDPYAGVLGDSSGGTTLPGSDIIDSSKIESLVDEDGSKVGVSVGGTANVVSVSNKKKEKKKSGKWLLLHPSGKKTGKKHRHANVKIHHSTNLTGGRTYHMSTIATISRASISKFVTSHKIKYGGKLRRIGGY